MADVMRRAVRALRVALCCALAMALAACGGKASEEDAVREAVEATFAVFQSPTEEAIGSYIDQDTASELAEYGVDATEFLAHAFKYLEHTVGEVTVDDGNAQVPLSVSNVNLEEAMNAALEAFDTWSDTDDAVSAYKEGGDQALYQKLFSLLYEQIDAMGATPTTNDVTLYLQRDEEGNWDVADAGNEAFYEALYGGARLSL